MIFGKSSIVAYYAISVYMLSIPKKDGSNSEKSEEEEIAMENSVLRPNSRHFGLSCKNPVKHTLSDILLAINFNHPHYSNIPILKRLYKHVFPHHVFCGPVADPEKKYKIIVIAHPVMQRGFYGYHCLARAIKKHPGFSGYLYVNDDMIVNWWMFLGLDKSKIWTGSLVDLGHSTQVGVAAKTQWWKRADTARRCTEAFLEIETEKGEEYLKQYYRNTNNERVCVNTWSDIFYIPAELSSKFAMLSQIFYDHLVFVEAAVQMSLFYLDDKDHFIKLNGIYLPDKFAWAVDYGSPALAWQVYTRELMFIHPYKLAAKENRENFDAILLGVSDQVLQTSCLDIVYKDKAKNVISNFKWKDVVKVDWSKYG